MSGGNMSLYTRDTPVPRTFECKRCGDSVTVTERGDHRMVFCCEYCEREFWRHRDRYERRKQNEVGHMTNEWRDRATMERV